LGTAARDRPRHYAIYSLLVAMTAIMLFPVAWDVHGVGSVPTSSVNEDPAQWIPTVFTLEPYLKVLGSPRYLWTLFVNSYFIAIVVTAFSLFIGRWQPTPWPASASRGSGR